MEDIKQLIKAKARALGFEECGFAQARKVSDEAIAQYDEWLAEGKNDCMEYAERYRDVRANPCELLPGAKTVISVALGYYPNERQRPDAPQFSIYAYGRDYHLVAKERLTALAEYIREAFGAESSRVCVDTAPIMEKYWAREAGVGFIGRNNLLIVPGKGSFYFLGELVTTLDVAPDKPCTLSCGECNACVKACPGGALTDGKSLDARRCLSCQLIERRGDLPQWVEEVAGNRVYGCDACQMCCPHNKGAVSTQVSEFNPRAELMSLTLDDILVMTQERFADVFKKSAVKRTKLEGLQRNARLLFAKKS